MRDDSRQKTVEQTILRFRKHLRCKENPGKRKTKQHSTGTAFLERIKNHRRKGTEAGAGQTNDRHSKKLRIKESDTIEDTCTGKSERIKIEKIRIQVHCAVRWKIRAMNPPAST